jgi:PAS domain S-box-containing protein
MSTTSLKGAHCTKDKDKKQDQLTKELTLLRRQIVDLKRSDTERKRVEKALRDSETRYRRLFESAQDGILILEADTGKIIDVNPFLIEMLGYTHKEYHGKQLWEIGLFKDIVENKIAFKRLQKEKYIRYEHLPLKAKDGTQRDVEFVSNVYLVDGAKVIQCNIRDITERKQAEQKLQESEDRFRTLVEAAPDCVLVHDDEGTILYINEMGAQQLEWPEKDIIGRNLRDIVAPEQGTLIADHIRETHEVGWSRFETTYVSRSGWQLIAEVNDRLIKFGKKKAILRVARDITERKQAEKKLLESEARYRMLFERASDGIALADAETGRLVSCNHALCNMVERDVAELIGQAQSILHPPQDTTEGISASFQQHRTENPKDLLEDRLLTKDGRLIPVEVKAARIQMNNRDFLLGIFRDISERKKTEESLRQGHEQLRENLNLTVNALTSTVEMRDPYTAGHQQRVSILAGAIAAEMGLSQDSIEGIRVAGSIHDIGKIVVPAEILSKPGSLSQVQYEMVKMHPQTGHDILKGIKFPAPVARIVLQHHERVDGSGYPQGMKGEEILLEARILAVADVVEAMSSHRPYRPSFGIDKALEKISQNRGVLFDPDVVDACLRLFSEKGFQIVER